MLTEDRQYQGGGSWETMRLLQLQNIVENGLFMRIDGRGSIIPTRTRYTTTEAVIEKLQGCIADALMQSSYVLSVMQLMLLMLIPKN